ncbi:MAG: hypothetical protein A3A98_01910 [Candidatus Staskawiczbacteria bacterium RIFCSPLOWO2_01_FULL_40_39]|uniref:Endolytic murein transglycosylase n=1 Tax=Candidatus Staskawiczbacteria bacterium RIFCSPHIGHO2_01_FULL_39_25 TaxID=1802202 RepID=A0A1G2HQG2_9BACT|nr:MAG: hypothetical protein A2730_02065 [Candidatus Staskawiczbacteria bacterium RIFCSPHIGHO2_01_FULL_39_25]OGZ72725.1 MAG: hypothetical protein A3A98_01910 [Candidatus Staskawiczbacteria bacterium RIFCSPLOWO2_01_FULL_40_39]
MDKKLKKNLKIGTALFMGVVLGSVVWGMYIPKSFQESSPLAYEAKEGMGYREIASDLKNQGLIKSKLFFELYVLALGDQSKLQAGTYSVSSLMSAAAIAKKFVMGDIMKEKITILEGWDIKHTAQYLESKKLFSQADFLAAAKKDWSYYSDILKDRPKYVGIEGYLFPDTYKVPVGSTPEEVIPYMLSNFNRKLTPELRKEIARQKKSVFQIVTMASMLEKEVRSLEDKKMVAGILWKRMETGMPLQVDATVNYATNKNTVNITTADKKINSPYNTYKYKGLPLGPISNPGIDSIMAAVYPTKSPYWYYLSARGTGKTIYSKTFQDHLLAIVKYRSS